MSDRKRAHVVLKYDVDPNEWHCRHCGDRTPIRAPVEVELLVKRGEAYARMHEDCERTREEDPDA